MYDDDADKNSPRGHQGYHQSDNDEQWPECRGQCFAGTCRLQQQQQAYPGCCYPASLDDHPPYGYDGGESEYDTNTYGGGGGRGYGVQAQQGARGGDDAGGVGGNTAGLAKPTHEGLRGGSNTNKNQNDLICWRAGEAPSRSTSGAA